MAAHGSQVGLEFYTGYLIEKSLSVDNLFVFILILGAFAVPRHLQQRVLLYGIVGALALRATFIALGAAALAAFDWVFLVFGVILLLTAAKILRDAMRGADHHVDVDQLRSPTATPLASRDCGVRRHRLTLDRACPRMLEDLKHGRWSFPLSAGLDPVTKKRRQVNGSDFGGPWDTKREAQQARNTAAVRLDRGKYQRPNRETLAEYLPKWLDRRSRTGLKGGKPLAGSTLENYTRYAAQDIVPSRLGSMRLRDIRRGHVQAFIDDPIEASRGAVTVRRIVAVVQGALSSAVSDELIDETPARLLELPPVDAQESTPWEPEQVGHFLDVTVGHRLGALFEVAIFTGIRRGALGHPAALGRHSPGRRVEAPGALQRLGDGRHLQPPPGVHRARRGERGGSPGGTTRGLCTHTAHTCPVGSPERTVDRRLQRRWVAHLGGPLPCA